MYNFRIEIKWAVIFALMQIVWMLLENLLGLHDEYIEKHAIYTNFIAIPAILIYFFAFLEKRKKEFGGFMTFKQGFITGLKITLIVALLNPGVQVLTANIIAPDYFPNVREYTIREEIMTKEQAYDYFNLNNYIAIGFVGALLMGLFTSVVVAFATMKKAK